MIGAELQIAIVAALAADPPLCDGRIYDRVPVGAVFPYLTVGDEQVVDDGNSCSDGWEVYADIHAWSRPTPTSKVELKTLAAAAVTRLNTLLAVAGFTVVIASLESLRSLRDPDGLTEHAVITMKYVLQPE
jgi:hypothetical protein